MNIGFDLDKVFIDYPPFIPDTLFNKFYKKKDNGVLLYRIPSYPEQLLRKSLHMPILRPGIKENLAFLRSISKREHKLFLISSRFKFLEGTTQRLIKKYELDKVFDGLYFNFANEQPHLFKDRIISKLNLDLYIDDDLSLLRHVARNNARTKFFWLTPQIEKHSLPKNIFAISHLPEIFSFFENSK
jgi:hypothetical protein